MSSFGSNHGGDIKASRSQTAASRNRVGRWFLTIFIVLIALLLLWWLAGPSVFKGAGPDNQGQAGGRDSGSTSSIWARKGKNGRDAKSSYHPLSALNLEQKKRPAHLIVRGTVEDPHGAPVADAAISAYLHLNADMPDRIRFEGLVTQTFSNLKGSFELKVDPDFAGMLAVEHPGFARIGEWVKSGQGYLLTKHYVLHRASAILTGYVREAGSGKPVEGAPISISTVILQGSGTPPGMAIHDGARSDPEGRYRIEGLETGTTFLQVLRRGYAPLYDTVKIAPGESEKHHDFRLMKSKAFKVLVTDPGQRPVSAAKVKPGRYVVSESTDEDGQATLYLASQELAGGVDCRVAAQGFLDQWVKLKAPADSWQVILEPAPVLEGSVVNEEGEALVGAGISIWCGASERDRYVHGNTDEEGRFQLSIAKPPVLSVSVSHPEYLGREFRFKAGEAPSQLQVVLEGGSAAVFGQVLSAQGAPVREFNLTLNRRDPGSGGWIQRTINDPEGHFSVTGLPEGTYEVTARRVLRGRPEATRPQQAQLKSRKALGPLLLRFEARKEATGKKN